MKNPIVSVIMAAYNSEHYISEAINSIINQTFKDFELIITNDCSTDNTANIISSYDDHRIKVLNNETNKGAPYSRNRAIMSAKGKYLAILDADDISLPDRLKEQVDYLEKHKEIDIAGSYVYQVNQNGLKTRTIKAPIKDDQIKSSTFFRCSIVHSSAMIRYRFFIENNLFYDESYPSSQDYEMWSRAILSGKIHTLPKFLTLYRQSETQMSNKQSKTQQTQAERVYLTLLKRIGLNGTEKEVRLHTILINQIPLSKNDDIQDIYKWAINLFEKNLKTKLFNQRAFANELLLRFLRFSFINRIGLIKTILLQFKLHLHLRKFYFPYHLLLQRLSREIRK
jgi:glycosyltransferase involved in cell wall biosynthesis